MRLVGQTWVSLMHARLHHRTQEATAGLKITVRSVVLGKCKLKTSFTEITHAESLTRSVLKCVLGKSNMPKAKTKKRAYEAQ